MAEPNDPKPVGKSGSEAVSEDERRSQGYAVAGLHALSASLSPDLHSESGLGGRDDAIQQLAEAVREDRLGIPRVLVLDALVKLASRRPLELERAGTDLDALLQALVEQAQVPAEHRGDAVGAVRIELDRVARLSAIAPVRNPWPQFAQGVAGVLRLSQAEVDKPLCNDREVVRKGGVDAIGVTVDFHTDAAPAQMTVCDPMRWHECTAAFHEMVPTGPGALDETRPNGWRRDLLETVDFMPELTLETPLRFTYSIDAGPDPQWVHLDYVLLEETDDIDVDEGSIDVRRASAGKHAGRTRVSTKKLIHFKNELLADWPTVACDTFWSDLVVNAAVGCLGGGANQALAKGDGGTAFMADQNSNELSSVIEDAAEAARQSIDAYTELAQQAAAQVSGDAPADNAAWLQLTTKAYGRALSDVAKSWTLYSEMLTLLAESPKQAEGAAKPPPDPPDPPPDV